MLEVLLDRGADVQVKGSHLGDTPLDGGSFTGEHSELTRAASSR